MTLSLGCKGEVLLTRDLPAHARSAAVNPFDGTLWVGVDGELIRYDDEGRIKARWSGFRHPASIAFAASGIDLRTDLRCTLAFYTDLLC